MPTLRQYVNALKSVQRANEKAQLIRAELAKDCKHPEGFVVPYEWEHDNGYGRQRMIKAKRCTICRQVDRWNDGRFADDSLR